MMMKNFFSYAAAVAAMAAISLLLAAVPPTVKAQSPSPPPPPPNCNVSELFPCFPAYFGFNPTDDCCQKLKAQQPCFCVYASDPNLASYVNSTDARRIAARCNVTYPTNCP